MAVSHRFVIHGTPILVFDTEGSNATQIVANELQHNCYRLDQVKFAPGDVVLDIGAHIGMFSIYLALHFPEVIIHSFEPFPDNYELFRWNLGLNRVPNVHLHELAISSDGRYLEMATNPMNSGGATCNSTTLSHRKTDMIRSVTLDHIFDSLGIGTCRLMKIDCEGSEYEILLSTRVLPRVNHLCGEFHINRLLMNRGYSIAQLRQYCEQYIDPNKIYMRSCRMSE